MGMVFDLLFGRKISVSITPQDVIDHIHEGLHPSISATVENKINLRWFEVGRRIYSSTSAFKTKLKSPLVYRNNLNAVYPEVFEFNEGAWEIVRCMCGRDYISPVWKKILKDNGITVE